MQKTIFLLFLSALLQVSCQNGSDKTAVNGDVKPDTTKPRPNPYLNSKTEFTIFNNDTTPDSAVHGYGYNIFVDGVLKVHQPHIPAVSGNNGFSSNEKAEKAATFIVYKIKNNIMPPSVTEHELDSVGALK